MPAEQLEQLVTPTGWRFVGRATELVTNPLVSRESLDPGGEQNGLFAARFRLRPRIGRASVVPAVLAALHGAIAREWKDAPPLLRDRPLSRPPARFHGLSWMADEHDHAWTGELVWRHPHPTVPGAPCTTHVIVEERTGHASLAVRVTSDDGLTSVRGFVGAGQARPTFISELARSLRITFAGHECVPTMLEDDEIDAFVRETLLSETREHPVALLAPLEAGGYVMPLTELGEELLGLAPLHVMGHHATTFRLTDTLGDRRLSCYWGALRIYMPGFSCADRPEDHPLLMHDRLMDPVIRAGLIGRLGRHAVTRVKMPTRIAEREDPSPTAAPITAVASGSAEAQPPTAPGVAQPAVTLESVAGFAALSTLLVNLDARIDGLGTAIAQLAAANSSLGDEIARLRTTTALRSSAAASLERRFEALQQTIHEQLLPPPSLEAPVAAAPGDVGGDAIDFADTPSLVDVIRDAATSHGDALLVLDSAERSAAESPYEDANQLAIVLDAMAAVARRRQEGALGTSLRDAFRELGIDYRGGISPATPEKLRRQYLARGPDGRAFDCHEHLVLGSSYDPRYCLRVYFTSRAPVEPRFVIGHVGRHFDVKSTT